MTSTLRPQIEILVKLQNIESEINSIRAKLSELPGKVNQLDNNLKESERQVVDETTRIDDLKKGYRALEMETETTLAKIAKSEEKLTSVKTNKEYRSSLKEIDDLKEKNSKIEDDMLACLDMIEEAEGHVGVIKRQHAGLAAHIAGEKSDLDRLKKENESRLSALEAEWREISPTLDSELMERFTIVKGQQNGGLAVVPVSDEVCLGCHMNVPPQLYNDLQRYDKLHICPNCHRIIFWQPKNN